MALLASNGSNCNRALQQPSLTSEQADQRLQSGGGSGSSWSAAFAFEAGTLSLNLPAALVSTEVPISQAVSTTPAPSLASGWQRLRQSFCDDVDASELSDVEDYEVSQSLPSQPLPVGSLPRHLHGSYRAPGQDCATWLRETRRQSQQQTPSVHPLECWPVAESTDVVHPATATPPVPVMIQRPAATPRSSCDLTSSSFRPGSVMEGLGHKLSGTEAMRVRDNVLRQTGFLEPLAHQIFADHENV